MADAEILKAVLPLHDASGNAPCTPKLGRPTKLFLPILSSDRQQHDGLTSNIGFRGKPLPKAPDEFYKDLYQFHEKRGTPIVNMPRISGRVIDLHKLYSEVTERGGFFKVNARDDWDEIVPAVGLREKCLNVTAAIKQIYRRYLDKYERLTYFGEDPDKIEALESSDVLESTGRIGRARYPSLYSSNNISTLLNAVPMSYNHRQHIVNLERRRLNKMSTDLLKPAPYEKLILSLLSPLPNEQDFAINVCTLMSNEIKHTLKLNEHPKLLDILLAHAGIFADYTLRKLFEHVYADVRKNSLTSFWRDLLYDKPNIFELLADEKVKREAGLLNLPEDKDSIKTQISSKLQEYCSDDFFSLKRGEGTQDYAGQRVQQITAILRNLSFFDENLTVFAKSRTFMRYVVMASNVRWGNIHIQALDIAGNVATELELLDPATDDLSRSLLATLCEGIEGMDRAVILNCLEILYKICQIDHNEEYVSKSLNLKFYEKICQFLSLTDIMLLIYTLEAVYALTSTGTRACHLLMQVRGVIDQLVALITVEAQSYGADGCILMRVVETVPGNMLPMVAQNIANLQNVAVKQNHPQQQQHQQIQPQLNAALQANSLALSEISIDTIESKIQAQQQQQATSILPSIATAITTTIATSTTTMPTQRQTPPPMPQSQSHQTPNTNLQMPQNYTHDDEQYGLAWLGATFERSIEGRVEQQELYRMYLAHCQRSGKHSVVNHQQFPRLVRLIYNQNVGPITVRGADGVDLPGLHYVGIKLRAQPLHIQNKVSVQNSNNKTIETPIVAKGRAKKKIKPQPIPPFEQSNDTNSSSSESKIEMSNSSVLETKAESTTNEHTEGKNYANTTIEDMQRDTSQVSVIMDTSQQQQQSSTSLIKSLLANKVTQRQQKQKELMSNSTVNSIQQQLQQQQYQQPQQTIGATVITPTSSIETSLSQQSPIKVASTAISALVNNPLMQHTPVKVGQTTIKPLSLATAQQQHGIEKKTPILESTPPPLAPLSGNNVLKDTSGGRAIIIAKSTVPQPPRLVEIVDKKPQHHHMDTTPGSLMKRKLDNDTPPPGATLTSKRLALDETPVTPSKSAANLYAEIAASILEDEDMDEMPTTLAASLPTPPQTQQQQSQIVRIQPQQQQTVVSISSSPMQRQQLIFHQTSVSNPSLPQLKPHSQQIPTAMATIKTDQGLQTVPVILQQKSLDATQHLHLPQQTTTQYVLATNPQGQTYLVAQQTSASAPTPPPPPPPPPQAAPTQTVLVTQTPQQQSTGAKTIIILQQQPSQQIITTSGGQKMIMTTPQGQQVLVTQRPGSGVPQTQQQIFINPQTGAATNIHVSTAATAGPAVTTSNTQATFQRQIMQQQQSAQHQPHAGQISPTLLSQLNQIPATIKLHQPQPAAATQSTPQPATISRISKPVSMIQNQTQLQIPPLQQHQSIIQQHIVSGPAEKRQVILSGGRTIEIKETIITQAQPNQLHQSQLNSQTIITTTQPQTVNSSVIQQQQQHSQLGQQQKLCTPVLQQQSQMTAGATFISPKIADPPSLIPTSTIAKPQQSAMVQSIVPSQAQTLVSNAKKTSSNQVLPGIVHPHMQPNQQAKIQVSTTAPTLTTSKPLFAGSGPPPLAAVSGNLLSQSSPMVSNVISNSNILATPQQPENKQIDASNKQNSTIVASVATSLSTTTTSSVMVTQNQISQQQQTTNITTPIVPPPVASLPSPMLPHPSLPTVVIPPIDPNWPYVCDWRNCPRRKYKSLNELQYHVTTVHCPDHLDSGAEIFCQWGASASLCDGVPRKRFSLMTHLIDRHLSTEALKTACQRRIVAGTVNVQPSQPPVTIMRNPEKVQQLQQQNNNVATNTAGTAAASISSSTPSAANTMGYSALHAIKRHTSDFINAKELMDENEGPVTKSIRLTAALILRNLVTYTDTAKRSLRRYEPHLSNIALSNVESSVALSHILAELNDTNH